MMDYKGRNGSCSGYRITGRSKMMFYQLLDLQPDEFICFVLAVAVLIFIYFMPFTLKTFLLKRVVFKADKKRWVTFTKDITNLPNELTHLLATTKIQRVI